MVLVPVDHEDQEVAPEDHQVAEYEDPHVFIAREMRCAPAVAGVGLVGRGVVSAGAVCSAFVIARALSPESVRPGTGV